MESLSYHFITSEWKFYGPLMYFLKLFFKNSVKQAHSFSEDVNMPCRLLALHEYQIETMILIHCISDAVW